MFSRHRRAETETRQGLCTEDCDVRRGVSNIRSLTTWVPTRGGFWVFRPLDLYGFLKPKNSILLKLWFFCT